MQPFSIGFVASDVSAISRLFMFYLGTSEVFAQVIYSSWREAQAFCWISHFGTSTTEEKEEFIFFSRSLKRLYAPRTLTDWKKTANS